MMSEVSNAIKKKLKNVFGKNVFFEYLLSHITTLRIGGPAQYFVIAKNEKDIFQAVRLAQEHNIPFFLLGGASNIVANDNGVPGLVVKNAITSFDVFIDKNICRIGAGHSLLSAIKKMNLLGLSGMERMAGIPGTIGGAIYGCAGAYGQEIKDSLRRVRYFDGTRTRWLSKKACQFGYRTSIFKVRKDWIILEAEFRLAPRNSKELTKTSKHIIKLRAKKYPPKLACPGSFFKNIVIQHITPKSLQKQFLKRIDQTIIKYGKITSGYILEQVSAKGLQKGGIAVAAYHGNLIYNTGGGTARDIKKVVTILKKRVHKKFGILLEEEVQYL